MASGGRAAATSTPAPRTRRANGSSGPSRRSRAARHGIAFASGSAATAAIAQLAPPGDEIVVGDDVYGGTFRYFERVHRPSGVDARYADLAAGPDALWEELTARTRLVWFESPTNPYLKLIDIAAVAATVRERAAQAGDVGRLIVVDNTFASPAIQRPLGLGADIVFHSATKYLAGHSDTVCGVVVTNDDAIAERLRFLQNAMGAVPGPLDCFLVLRGLRTLHLRVERHSANALAVAQFLAGRDDVDRVIYPGLAEGRARPSRRGDRRSPDAIGRRHGLVHPVSPRRSLGRQARDRHLRGDAAVHARRVARRRGVADRAAGRDDPPLGRRFAARGR